MITKTLEVRYFAVPDGQIHETFIERGRRLDDGRCNLDDALTLVEVPEEEISTADPGRLCGHCFPWAGNPDAPE